MTSDSATHQSITGTPAAPVTTAHGMPPMMKKDFLSILDLEPSELTGCLELALELKRDRVASGGRPIGSTLRGAHVALLFDKPSLRTRSTFEIAVRELGGEIIEPRQDSALGCRESISDVAHNLERWVSGAVLRTFGHGVLVEFARAAAHLHVVNALSDEEHPCQALADALTLQERWSMLSGRTLAFVGDGNNVATSLAHVAARLGLSIRLASPEGYELPEHRLAEARAACRSGARVDLVRSPQEAVSGADAVYTDAWTSMGQEPSADERRRVFEPYRVDAALMSLAAPDAVFMHCLPAHRGEEVTDEVIDSPASIVFDQAENRLHAQKALLTMLMAHDA